MSSAQLEPPARRTVGGEPPEPASPWDRLREANRLLRSLSVARLAEHDLALSDFLVLDLCARGPAKASDVATATGLTAAGATGLIDRIEGRRLVRRVSSPTDRRVVLIALTPAGERTHAKLAAIKRDILRYLDSALRPEEMAALTTGLDALTRALRREAERTRKGG